MPFNRMYIGEHNSSTATLYTIYIYILSTFRDRGVSGPTSEMSPRAPAQMGRREAEREGGKRGGRRQA
jgi:hypothetical protein